MKNTQPTFTNTDHHVNSQGTAPSGDSLELFAEELPAQQDLMPGACFGCLGTAACATGGGSTFSTLSSMSSL